LIAAVLVNMSNTAVCFIDAINQQFSSMGSVALINEFTCDKLSAKADHCPTLKPSPLLPPSQCLKKDFTD